MTIIRFLADDQDLKVVARIKLASGNKKSVMLQVKFSKEWKDYTKSAVFFREDGQTVYEVLLTGEECLVPHEVLAKPGEMIVGIRGVTPETEKRSSLIKYEIAEGAPVGDGIPVDPTPDIYQQILARLKEMETITHSWNGTVLTVTSSSGSSSADLQGEPGMAPPLVLDAGDAESYLTDPAYGDEALEAIIRNRQILVRTPNADGGKFTAIYSPILTYQLPNYENKYLYLFYLRDEKQDLSGILGADIKVPVYGELKMLLSETYNESPLVNPQEHLSDTLVYLKGKDGITPKITAVTTETLKPGAAASAEISGAPAELTLKLGIPQGEPGESPTISASTVRYPDGRTGTRLEINNPDGTRHVATVYDGQTPTIEAERFEAANYWEMSSQDANGNAVYLYPGNSGSAGYPNRAAEYSRLNLTAGSEENTFSIVANDADVSNMDSCYLYFDRSNLRWDRVSAPGSNATWKTNTSLRLYRAAVEGEDSSTEIPGYVRITSLDYVVEGRYLIAAPGNDGGIYLLYPSTAAANRYQQTAKVIDGNTAGIGSDNSFSAGTVALTACLYTFAKNAESWESGVNLTVTNPGTDDQEDTRTTVRVLDGKNGVPGKPGGTVSTAPKPIFVISGSYNGGACWVHKYGDGAPATVEEMVDAFFDGGICKIETSGDFTRMWKTSGYFIISQNTVNYDSLLIYGATEEQYLAALSKYLPEGADAG